MTNQNLQTAQSWGDIIGAIESDFVAVSEAKEKQMVTWREEAEYAVQAINKNPSLAKCTPYSVQAAVKNIASVGLTLNPVNAYAYLVPEYVGGGQQCQLRISYKGLIKLAENSGVVKLVKADVVRENDVYIDNGMLERPTFKKSFPFDEEKRGKPVGVFCIAKLDDGTYLVETAPWADVMSAKEAAKTKNVWNKWESEMAKKFIIKRAYKTFPSASQELSIAVNLLNDQEGSRDESSDYTEDEKEKFMKYLETGTAIEFAGYIDSLDEKSYASLYNSFKDGDKVSNKKLCAKKQQEGIKQIRLVLADMNSDDSEVAEDATEALNPLEVKILNRWRDK